MELLTVSAEVVGKICETGTHPIEHFVEFEHPDGAQTLLDALLGKAELLEGAVQRSDLGHDLVLGLVDWLGRLFVLARL